MEAVLYTRVGDDFRRRSRCSRPRSLPCARPSRRRNSFSDAPAVRDAAQEWLADPQRAKPVLLDVREPWEFETCRIAGSLSMPMRGIPARYHELKRDAEIVMVCHHGARSFQAGMFLEQMGFTGIINLHGGVAAWARDVDPAMPTY
jgi:rhodanese-related sulfurtransferase